MRCSVFQRCVLFDVQSFVVGSPFDVVSDSTFSHSMFIHSMFSHSMFSHSMFGLSMFGHSMFGHSTYSLLTFSRVNHRDPPLSARRPSACTLLAPLCPPTLHPTSSLSTHLFLAPSARPLRSPSACQFLTVLYPPVLHPLCLPIFSSPMSTHSSTNFAH
jgi:hypothetical protein